MSPTITLPDLSAGWPWERTINPHFESAAAASLEWLESYHVLEPKAQAAFNRCKFALLASLAYPLVDAEHLRLSCDLMNWFFVFDEVTDIENGEAARETSDICIGALRCVYFVSCMHIADTETVKGPIQAFTQRIHRWRDDEKVRKFC